MPNEDPSDGELVRLSIDTGIDLTVLPAVATARELAPVLGITEASLAQDRYHRVGIPYVKFGRRVRYLRTDIARYLAAHRAQNRQEVVQGDATTN
jgi:hypothetical protein